MASSAPLEPFSKDLLRDALDGVSYRGDFTWFEAIPATDARIKFNGVRTYQGQMSQELAAVLTSRARRATSEQGSETSGDTSERRAWELTPEQFHITEPAWPCLLDTILQRTARILCIDFPISAHLSKMLLYDERSRLKAHYDTARDYNKLGTLVISLPSEHEGGEDVVHRPDNHAILRTSQHKMSFGFWFSDVSHEVLPVTSGFRWVLVYNVTWNPATERQTIAMALNENRVRRALASWTEKAEHDEKYLKPLYCM
ncbi:hypothetical protein GGR56DRAFT_183068 [Xylariaceae sp. FL0804]|nr:hypothetical protein GGR56DRAFT_183068 [Xylariaceae sp. FL0804]